MNNTVDNKYMKKINGSNGFIAALDQSGGSTPKALGLYGIGESEYSDEQEMFKKVPFENAAKIFKNMITKDNFDDFLTLPLYEKI